MNTKRIASLVVVALLLAALPGMTAVRAQGQDPAVPGVILQGDPETGLPIGGPESQAPTNNATMPPLQNGSKEQIGTRDPTAVAEPGESQAPDFNVQESESNNTRATANLMTLGDVMRGNFYPSGDLDYFKFNVPYGAQILIDIDARSIGSTSDTVVKLYNAAGTVVGQNDDADGSNDRDSLLYRVPTGGWYYVEVKEYDGIGCTNTCFYNLIVSSPLLISAHAANLGTGNVAGIPFQSQDVLAHSDLKNGQQKWLMFLDGSDVGFTKDVKNISTGWVFENGSSPSFAVSFGANVTLTDHRGVRRVFTPWDWAVFNFENVGTRTQISAIEYHAGAEHGLSAASEKLDALDLSSSASGSNYWVDLLLSTTGGATVPRGAGTLKLADEDILWSATRNGQGYWDNNMWFDGSTVQGLAVEDVFAADINMSADYQYLTILGTGNVLGHAVTQKDIFLIMCDTSCIWGGYAWRGPQHGWNYNIDAIDWPGQ